MPAAKDEDGEHNTQQQQQQRLGAVASAAAESLVAVDTRRPETSTKTATTTTAAAAAAGAGNGVDAASNSNNPGSSAAAAWGAGASSHQAAAPLPSHPHPLVRQTIDWATCSICFRVTRTPSLYHPKSLPSPSSRLSSEPKAQPGSSLSLSSSPPLSSPSQSAFPAPAAGTAISPDAALLASPSSSYTCIVCPDDYVECSNCVAKSGSRLMVLPHPHPVHSHLIRSAPTDPPVTCDGCRRPDVQDHFRCKTCPYRECDHCHHIVHRLRNSSAALPRHPHPLARNPPGARGQSHCAICRSVGVISLFHCTEPRCPHIECYYCLLGTGSDLARKPHAHPLAKRQVDHADVRCDVCFKSALVVSFRCERCDYDECEACFAANSAGERADGGNGAGSPTPAYEEAAAPAAAFDHLLEDGGVPVSGGFSGGDDLAAAAASALECVVCFDTVRAAQTLECCNQLVCGACVDRWRDRCVYGAPTCPHCRRTPLRHTPNIPIDRLVSALRL
ncbi:hypothetical protein DFJ73DRAFT_88466 [Zopfochytrium polystomum]|nr:hypothetical protein DFJ73DRAFT_88466 [Zopfochytrium polystomum]